MDSFWDGDMDVREWTDREGDSRYLCSGCYAKAELTENRQIEREKQEAEADRLASEQPELELESESETIENEELADANLKENSNESSKETEEETVVGGEG